MVCGVRSICSQESYPLLRLRVVADADPSAIALVADRFRNLNALPRRLLAEFGSRLLIEVDVCGMPEEQFSLIANKIAQSPIIHHTHWTRYFESESQGHVATVSSISSRRGANELAHLPAP